MRARRGALGVVCAVALTALAAACGGGADDPVADAPVDAGIPPPTGVSADRSAANAIAALGPPGPVDRDRRPTPSRARTPSAACAMCSCRAYGPGRAEM